MFLSHQNKVMKHVKLFGMNDLLSAYAFINNSLLHNVRFKDHYINFMYATSSWLCPSSSAWAARC